MLHIGDLILNCICPHTTPYRPSYYYMCVLIRQAGSDKYAVKTIKAVYYNTGVRILLYMGPHTIIYVSSYAMWALSKAPSKKKNTLLHHRCPHSPICGICASSYYYQCFLILPYMCPHTTSGL